MKNRLLVRKPWHLLVYRCYSSGTVVDPLQNTPTRLPSRPDPVSEPACPESDVPLDESSVAPGSMQISPRELTRSQSELVRSSLENADPTTVRRRIVGKRTIIPPVPLALSDNVDSGSVPGSLPENGMPETLEPYEGDTKKRRVESFDESVDWFQRERSCHSAADKLFRWTRNILRLTLVILWNLKSPFVEIHPCGCQRDCQMGIDWGYLSPSPAWSTATIR